MNQTLVDKMLSDMPEQLKPTIGNLTWLKDNEEKLKELYPNTWTHVYNVSPFELLWGLKLLGVEYKTDAEVVKILCFLEIIKIVLRDGTNVRRNPHSIFE